MQTNADRSRMLTIHTFTWVLIALPLFSSFVVLMVARPSPTLMAVSGKPVHGTLLLHPSFWSATACMNISPTP